MKIYLIIIGVTIVTGFILMISKQDFKKHEDWLTNLVIASAIGALICVILMFFDLKIKGRYTTSLIAIAFFISNIILFSITTQKRMKILTGIVSIPTIIFFLLSIFSESWLIFLLIPYFLFQAPKLKSQIDENHNVEIRDGGFLSCGESLIVTQSYLGVFDKLVHFGTNHCAREIYKVETIEFNDSKYVFNIFHNCDIQDENPLRYEVDFK